MEENTLSAVDRERRVRSNQNMIPSNIQSDVAEKNVLIDKLSRSKYKIFVDYLEWLGMDADPNFIILSPTHHYYYDDEDLKEVTTVLNLKQLNHIKEVKDFLRTINEMLPVNSYFIGSFIDRKHQIGFFSTDNHMHGSVDPVENGITSRIPILNMIYDFMDSRTNNRNMTSKSVSALMAETGFKILDFTEINGITCFCSQKIISQGYE
jgi:hypothetical protein